MIRRIISEMLIKAAAWIAPKKKRARAVPNGTKRTRKPKPEVTEPGVPLPFGGEEGKDA